MNELRKDIINFRDKKSLSVEDCAKYLSIDVDTLLAIENGTINLSEEEIEKINEIIKPKNRNSRRIIKILDLIFRFSAMVMGLVVLLLCINGYTETQTLIAMLSIGVVCSALTMLPKIEK